MSPDLRSTYLGLQLESPLVASASPLTGNLDSLRALEAAGAAAVVLPSLFEEQIEHDETTVDLVLERGAQSFGEALTYFPEMDDYNTGPGVVRRARRRGQGGALDPGDRLDQRRHAGRLDPVRRAAAGGGRRRDRAQRLRGRDRSLRLGRERRGSDAPARQQGARRAHASRSPSRSGRTTPPSRTPRRASPRPARPASSSSTASCSRTSTSRR